MNYAPEPVPVFISAIVPTAIAPTAIVLHTCCLLSMCTACTHNHSQWYAYNTSLLLNVCLFHFYLLLDVSSQLTAHD